MANSLPQAAHRCSVSRLQKVRRIYCLNEGHTSHTLLKLPHEGHLNLSARSFFGIKKNISHKSDECQILIVLQQVKQMLYDALFAKKVFQIVINSEQFPFYQ